MRYYEWRGQLLLSVTSLRRLIGTPFQLANWQVGQVVDAAITMTLDGSLPKSLGPIVSLDALTDREAKMLAETKTALRRAAMANRDRAADLGTRVHAAAEARKTSMLVPPDEAPFLDMFYKAEKAIGLTITHSERQVFNLTLGYAGTLDFLGTREARIVLGDLKTGKGLYTEHLIQLILYAISEFAGADGLIDREATNTLHKVDTLGILHLRPTEWEWIELDPDPASFRAAKNVVELANYLRDNDNLNKHIRSRLHGS